MRLRSIGSKIAGTLGAELLILFALAFNAVAAAPDLWEIGTSNKYELDLGHGDPFTSAYNSSVNPDDPADIPALRDPSHDFYLFEPARTNGKPIGARPLVAYFHGADINPSPEKQRRQIEYYVRHGFVVVWMPFCDTRGFCLDFALYDDNAAIALRDALSLLSMDGHVEIALNEQGDPRVGFVGFSLGSHVAARVAGAGEAAKPYVIILHDGAGYEASVIEPIENLNLPKAAETFVINLVIGFIEGNGWGWDDPDSATRTYQIKHALPLDQASLSGISPDTLFVALGAAESEFGPNAVETVRRIYHRIGSKRKLAAIIPHVCASEEPFNAGFVYKCPEDLSGAVNNTTERFYYSEHDLFSGALSNRLFDSAVLLQTTNCLLENPPLENPPPKENADSTKPGDSNSNQKSPTAVSQKTAKSWRKPGPAGPNPLCTGVGRRFTGVWSDSNGALLRRAERKHEWLLLDPDS